MVDHGMKSRLYREPSRIFRDFVLLMHLYLFEKLS